jgi:hypothetical protein
MRLQRVFRESVRFGTPRFSPESRRSPAAVLSSGVFCQENADNELAEEREPLTESRI